MEDKLSLVEIRSNSISFHLLVMAHKYNTQMKYSEIARWFLVFVIVSNCCYNHKNINNIQTIDIEKNINNMEVLNMSNFISNIKYIPLENVEGVPLTAFSDFDISDNLIIKTDMNVCLLYNASGKLIRKFGKSGRGPNEYMYAANLNLLDDRKIYFRSFRNLFEYNIDGSFINKYLNTFMVDEKYYITFFYPLNDSLFIGHIPNVTGKIGYKAVIFNKYGQDKHIYKNYILFNSIQPKSIGSEKRAYFYRFKNKVYYKDRYNDTLFYLNDKYQLLPEYAFKLGRYKQPASERAITGNLDNDLRYIFLNGVLQTENHLFISCDFGEYFPSRRFTPSKISGPNSKYAMFNTTNCLGVYDKQTQKLVFSKPTSTDNPLFTSGLYNDIDGGPRFFPWKNINDSTMVMWLDPRQLKDHIASINFKESAPKYPEKKLRLEALANKLSEFDNPVLMKVTFKK